MAKKNKDNRTSKMSEENETVPQTPVTTATTTTATAGKKGKRGKASAAPTPAENEPVIEPSLEVESSGAKQYDTKKFRYATAVYHEQFNVDSKQKPGVAEKEEREWWEVPDIIYA